jgi:hypothetical protein
VTCQSGYHNGRYIDINVVPSGSDTWFRVYIWDNALQKGWWANQGQYIYTGGGLVSSGSYRYNTGTTTTRSYKVYLQYLFGTSTGTYIEGHEWIGQYMNWTDTNYFYYYNCYA